MIFCPIAIPATIASNAAEQVATALALGEQLAGRLQVVERQLSEITREAVRDNSENGDARSHVSRIVAHEDPLHGDFFAQAGHQHMTAYLEAFDLGNAFADVVSYFSPLA